MTSLSDTLTVGLVLVLLFGAIALYLYTRIQQAEQKISLLESILLDLKMGLEIKSFSELPAADLDENPKGIASTESDHDHDGHDTNAFTEEGYTPFHDGDETHDENAGAGATSDPNVTEVLDVEEYKSAIADAVKEEVVVVSASAAAAPPSPYENMTLKELQALAKTRGITGAGTMKKGPILEALKTSDKIQHTPSEAGLGSSFLDTSAAFPSSESS
jgi:hypothetical protein